MKLVQLFPTESSPDPCRHIQDNDILDVDLAARALNVSRLSTCLNFLDHDSKEARSERHPDKSANRT